MAELSLEEAAVMKKRERKQQARASFENQRCGMWLFFFRHPQRVCTVGCWGRRRPGVFLFKPFPMGFTASKPGQSNKPVPHARP